MAKQIGTIGDVGVPEYDGGFVYETAPGEYEIEWVSVPEDFEDPSARWTIYRVGLDPEIPDWGDLHAVARSMGQSLIDLAKAFQSTNPMERAWAYESWARASYYGWYEFDQYPLELTVEEVEKRFSVELVSHDEKEIDLDNLDEFTQSYIETALWATTDNSHDDGGDPLDKNYDIDDIAPETLKQMAEDARAFQRDNAKDLSGLDNEQAGHDFFLTRERHGAGFWDRGLGDVGDRLTDAAHAYGSFDLYIGDDGKIHHN